MTAPQESRAYTTRASARPHRPQSADARATLVDVILAVIAVGLGLAIITDPTAGPIDGRHLLAVAAVLTLITRTTNAARRH